MHYYNTTSNCQGPQVLSPYEPGVCSANLNYGDGNDLSLPLENNSSFSEEERFDVNYKFCYVSLRFYGIPTPPPFISITFTDDKNVTTPFHMKFQFNITDINSPDVVHEADVKTGIRKLLCDTFQLPISRCTCEGDCLVVGYSQANSDSILQSTSLQLGVSINVLFDAADYLQYPDEDALTTFLGSKYNTAMTTFNILLQEFYINIITRYSQYFSTTSFFTNLTYRQFSIINYTLQPSLLPTLQPKISNRNNSMISSGTIAGVVIAVVLMIFIIISMYLYYSHIGKHLSSLSNFVGSNVNNSVAPDVEACTPSGHA